MEVGDVGDRGHAVELRLDHDQGGVDLRRRPESARGNLADDFNGGQRLDEDAQRAVVAGVGRGGHTLGDFPLDGESEAGEEIFVF